MRPIKLPRTERAGQLSSLSREPWIMTPWRGQAAARLHRRAATANAVTDNDNNVIEVPPSGAAATVHVPGLLEFDPWPEFGMAVPSNTCDPGSLLVTMLNPGFTLAAKFQVSIAPEGLVAKMNWLKIALRLVIVCTPSLKENAIGDTDPEKEFPRGIESVTDTVTLSDVVYGAVAFVKVLPV